MFSLKAARYVIRISGKSFSDAAAPKIAAPKVAAKVIAPEVAAADAAAPSGSTLGQRLSSCLVGMAIGYSVSFFMLTAELEESNRIFSDRLAKIEAALKIQ